MIYYMVRHKASGEFMPEMERGRGYSHWNPATNSVPKSVTGSPRLISTRRKAARIIVMWASNPNGVRIVTQGGYYGEEWNEDIDTKPDGRSREDLEVVEVNVEVIND